MKVGPLLKSQRSDPTLRHTSSSNCRFDIASLPPVTSDRAAGYRFTGILGSGLQALRVVTCCLRQLGGAAVSDPGD